MTDETRLDNELAAFTDRLLTGEDAQAAPEVDELAHVVRQFHHLVDPDSGPDPAFREHLAQRLNEEWARFQDENQAADEQQSGQQHAPPRDSWQRKLMDRRSSRSTFGELRRNRLVRLAAVAATLAAALFVAVLIAANSETSESGTASGNIGWPVIVGIVVVALLSVLVFWLGQRSKS